MRFLAACVAIFVGADVHADGPSFATDVQPILTKLGCNQGACHGSQYGKGGFKLSLRAFDDPADHYEIAKAAKARRVVVADPALSLFLTKPTMEIPHQGGKRMEKGSVEYRILHDWIAAGAPGPATTEAKLEKLVVAPAVKLVRPGEVVNLSASGVFSDRSEEVVTERASFDTSSAAVVKVDGAGKATVVGKGEATIMVRYLDRVTVCRLISPYAELPAATYADFKPHTPVDELWLARWKQLGLKPAKECSDVEFLRRAYFDLIGVAPTPDEIAKFLADKSTGKHERLIDALLERPEYVDYWTAKWGDLLRINRNFLQEKGMWSFHTFVREAIVGNRPLDAFVGEMLSASGSPFQNGPANFFRVGRQPEDWAENAAQVFLGVRMQCARCHHHPFENISQADYYGMTAFFTRVAAKPSEEFGIQGQDAVIYVRDVGEARHPRTGRPIRPTPLGAGPLAEERIDPVDRRRSLAAWLSERQNLALAKNLVNRYWGYFLGRGLVHPIDDLRVTNPPSSPEVMDMLAKGLVANKYDVKWLIRTIAKSRVYRLTSVAEPASAPDAENKYFTHYTVKRLAAEQLLDAIDTACGTREKFANLPDEYRAGSLPDTTVGSRFLDTFGRPRREIACECERVDAPNMSQALQLLTGRLLNTKVQAPDGRIAKLVKAKTPAPAAVRDLYLAAFCRPPTDAESKAAVELVGSAPNLKEGLEDLLWAMLNTREFQFNH